MNKGRMQKLAGVLNEDISDGISKLESSINDAVQSADRDLDKFYGILEKSLVGNTIDQIIESFGAVGLEVKHDTVQENIEVKKIGEIIVVRSPHYLTAIKVHLGTTKGRWIFELPTKSYRGEIYFYGHT